MVWRTVAVQAQKMEFAVYQEYKRIGTITARKTTEEDISVYEVETRLSFRLLMPQRLVYTSRAVYKGSVLQSSTAKSWLNDKLHHSCTTSRKGDGYEVQNDKEQSHHAGKISYSGVLLYFFEPKTVSKVFSEMTGQMNSLHAQGSGKYELVDSKSKRKQTYIYQNGHLQQAILTHVLLDLSVKRIR